MRKLFVFIVSAVLILMLVLPGCQKQVEKNISVGSKSFTEGYILGSMVSDLLENSGFTVDRKPGMQTFIIREALTTGQIDGYMEYTGTAYANFLKKTDVVRDPTQLFNAVKEGDIVNNIQWIAPMYSINDTYALAMKKNKVALYGTNLSQLAQYINAYPNTVTISVNHEFYDRADGFPAMASFYGLDVKKAIVKTLDLGIGYVALNSDEVDVTMVYSTDGLLKKYDLFVLDDDKSFFPIYNPAFSVRKEVLDKYPEITKILEPITNALTVDDMINLNYLVDVDGKDPAEVANKYLKDKGLIKQ
jgi:osmoprotectant transport system substrate-binding protein